MHQPNNQRNRGGNQRHGYGQGGGNRPEMHDFTQDFKKVWVEKGIDEEGIKFAEKLGKALSRNLTTSQIRAVYGELKRIQIKKNFNDEKISFLLLKPKMAYAATRNKSDGLTQLNKIFNLAYESVKADDDGAELRFNNLVNLMEAILAYHKAFGGK